MKALMVSLVIAASSAPALADFYIIQDTTSKRCRVVEERPAPSEAITLGTAFRERAVAEEKMRGIEACRDGTTGAGAGGAGVIMDEKRNEPRDRGNPER